MEDIWLVRSLLAGNNLFPGSRQKCPAREPACLMDHGMLPDTVWHGGPGADHGPVSPGGEIGLFLRQAGRRSHLSAPDTGPELPGEWEMGIIQ